MNTMRLPLETASVIAQRIRAELEPLCARIEIAGSIRRERPDCGDIDLVCLPKTFPHRKQIIDRCGAKCKQLKNGPQYAVFELQNGFQLDLWLAHDGGWSPQEEELFETPRENVPPNFGVLFLARTGSANFNAWFATHCKAKGLHFNPHKGVLHGERVLASENEEDLFRVAGLDVIPPTKRDDYRQPSGGEFWTDEAAPGVQFSRADFYHHMRTVHGIDLATTPGKKSLNMHLRKSRGAVYVYDWEIAGKKFTQTLET